MCIYAVFCSVDKMGENWWLVIFYANFGGGKCYVIIGSQLQVTLY
jgi:hypothetical protein